MMIKDKLIFSHDYSLINKKCFSCYQPTHMIENCPKLHYIPNHEKIIKTLNYSKSQERKQFHRRGKKSLNCLFFLKTNGDISKKIMKNLFSNISSFFSDVVSEENLSNDNESETETENETSDFDKKKNNKNFNEDNEKEDKKNISIDSNLEDDDEKKNEILNKKSSLNKSNNNNEEASSSQIDEEEKRNCASKENENYFRESSKKEEEISNDSFNNKEKNAEKHNTFEKGIQIQKTILSKLKQRNINTKQSQIKCDSTIVSCPNNEITFEKVENFSNYFPSFNIEQIINNQMFFKTMEKDINRKYLKRNYRKFKDYSFFVNEILERFWREKWKKSHKTEEENMFFNFNCDTTKNIENKSPKNNFKWKPSNSVLSKHHSKGGSPLKRESLNQSKIRSFGDLVKSALQKKENEKNSS